MDEILLDLLLIIVGMGMILGLVLWGGGYAIDWLNRDDAHREYCRFMAENGLMYIGRKKLYFVKRKNKGVMIYLFGYTKQRRTGFYTEDGEKKPKHTTDVSIKTTTLDLKWFDMEYEERWSDETWERMKDGIVR